ncbi:hypothetical protein KP509_07G033000 [Ceratopteris richardii]|uniref:Uncharacterized protein n=1 Tax=Ceratopteris richardii TaxID=49495 RepID=A0A8T2U9X1_CERRI|nr:hypothetical protein KP509_07G033000 [Ceratopteris richardii]
MKMTSNVENLLHDMEARLISSIDLKLNSKFESLNSFLSILTTVVSDFNANLKSIDTQFDHEFRNLQGILHYELSNLNENMETIANHVKEISSFKTIGHEIVSLKENIERLNNQIHESATCECKDRYQVRVQSRSMYSIDQNPLPDHRKVDPKALYQRPKRTVKCFWCDQLGHTYGNCMAYEKACSQQLVLESEQKICDYQTHLPLRLNLGRGGMIDYFDQEKFSPKTKLQKQWKPKSHKEKSNVCQLHSMNTKIVPKCECLDNDQNLIKPKSMNNIDLQIKSKDQDTLKKFKKEEDVKIKDDENEQSIDGNIDI